MGTPSKSEQEAFDLGQSDGAKGNYDHKPDGGFVDTILNRPMRDCTNEVRDAAYESGREIGLANRNK